MTMLDRMRRHKGWLKWSLALVILTFASSSCPRATTTGAAQAGAGRCERRADHRGAVPAPLRRADAGLPQRLRRPDQRADAAPARHRSADPAVAGRRAGGGGRGPAPEHARHRRRGAAAHPVAAGVPGERRFIGETRYRQLAAQEPAVVDPRVRGPAAQRHPAGEAAHLGRRLDVGARRRRRRASTAAATRR